MQGFGTDSTGGVAELGPELSPSHQQLLTELVELATRRVERCLNLAAAFGRGLVPEPRPPARGALDERPDAHLLRDLTAAKLDPQAPHTRGQHRGLGRPEQTATRILLCSRSAGFECATQSIQGIARTQVAKAVVHLLETGARSDAAPRGVKALAFT